MRIMQLITGCLALALMTNAVIAEGGEGEVRIPLENYVRLTGAADIRSQVPAYALGRTKATVQVSDKLESQEFSATVKVSVPVRVFEDQRTLVPILPGDVEVVSVAVDGVPSDLTTIGGASVWIADKIGSYVLTVEYEQSNSSGRAALEVSLPYSQASEVTIEAPKKLRDLHVAPAIIRSRKEFGEKQNLTVTTRRVPVLSLTWQGSDASASSISRATYTGRSGEKAVKWQAQYDCELSSDKATEIPLFPVGTTLRGLKVDGKNAHVAIRENRFVVQLSGKGPHTILADFETIISEGNGPLHTTLPLQKVPISQLEFRVDGRKTVLVDPKGDVQLEYTSSETIARSALAMSDFAKLEWIPAPISDSEEGVRSDVMMYHLAHAEEGILSLKIHARLQPSRGELERFSFSIPVTLDISEVQSENGLLSDWRVTDTENKSLRRLEVAFTHATKSAIDLTIIADQSMHSRNTSKNIFPLVNPLDAHRSRGFIALLSGKDSALLPSDVVGGLQIGENQLPEELRTALTAAVSHAYRYNEAGISLKVEQVAPIKIPGRFDATVSSLVSINDATLRGDSDIDISVKAGSLSKLTLDVPKGITVLSATAPSLRTHVVRDEAESQHVELEFTQQMEGQVRVSLSYEMLLGDKRDYTRVPFVAVPGSEVEQGRIAVEARAAVEVRATEVKAVSSVDITDLPQQLVLKTSNPILLAFKYSRIAEEPSIALSLTRHAEVSVQPALISDAAYRTIVTRDGVAVTNAVFMVKNSRSQFLRLTLPDKTKVWSASVNGTVEQPAFERSSDTSELSSTILLRIISSPTPFPVAVTYQSEVTSMRSIWGTGSLRLTVAEPDMTVTKTRWSLDLPDGLSYGKMNSSLESTTFDPGDDSSAFLHHVERNNLQLPKTGTHVVFMKLFSGGDAEKNWMSVTYFSWSTRIVLSLVAILAGATLVSSGKRSFTGWHKPLLLTTSLLLGVTLVWLYGLGFLALMVLGGFLAKIAHFGLFRRVD